MSEVLHPVTLLVGESSVDPIEVKVEGYGLKMVVVNKKSLRLLGDEWMVPGVYVLLGRPEDPDRYTAYVGKAPMQGLRTRVSQHVASAKNWDRALLITGEEFDSAAVGYLEGRFYDLLMNAAAADVLNGPAPRDETLQPYRRSILDRYAAPVTLAMRALGCPPDTADQTPTRQLRTRQTFKESVQDLIESGLLRVGTRLRPASQRYDGAATVRADGNLDVDGRTFSSVSSAACAVSGNSTEPGWDFWAASSGDGTMVTLKVLRERLRGGLGPETDVTAAPATTARRDPDPEPSPRRGVEARKAPRRFDVSLKELIDAGALTAGESLPVLRRRLGDLEGTLNADGSITVNGQTYRSPSAAAQAVTGGKAEPGWAVWGVRRNGKTITLSDVRTKHLDGSAPPS